MAVRQIEEQTQEQVTQPKTFNEVVAEAKKEAMKMKVCTIYPLNPDESSENNTAYLNCENQYFKVAKLVPLGEKVQLEQCLIENAKEAKMLIFVPQTGKDGVDTGIVREKFAPRYNVVMEN